MAVESKHMVPCSCLLTLLLLPPPKGPGKRIGRAEARNSWDEMKRVKERKEDE